MGDRLGRYELIRVLGVGGSGVLHEAVLHGPGGFRKPVALKVLRRQGDDLVEEARLGGMLRHPGLVEVYALERIDGRWVIAMELVAGTSLEKRLPLRPSEVVDVGLQVCEALAHAHADVGLVHLDLKPANLLYDGARVKVADFGIARSHATSTGGRVRGTPGYMAPEQRAGGPVDARADIWALGLTLLELATGRRDSTPNEVPWLAPIVARCLKPDPNDRFRSMVEVAEALRVARTALPDAPGAPPKAPRDARTSTTDATAETLDLLGLTLERSAIPADPDALIGRDDDLARLRVALDQPGGLVVKGLGGLGKTRLARAAARSWALDRRVEGWFVDLADATTGLDLLRGVARVLGVALAGADEAAAIAQVGHALASRGVCVLVLDNLEQAVDAVGVLGTLSAAASEARLLCTSRVPLPFAGDRTFELRPLDAPASIQLLVRRAADHGRDVSGDPDLPALAERLDGIPLALELAAGRLDLLSPRLLLERMNQRFQLLARRARSDDRQATLSGVIAWAWEQLDPEEQEVAAQLSVFVGGFTLEAAEAVVTTRTRFAVDVVQSLLDRSLLTALDGRLRMFESTREFAASHLTDRTVAERRHGAWFARLGTEASLGHLRTWAGLDEALALAPEADNIRAATERAIRRADLDQSADLVSLHAWQTDLGGSPMLSRALCSAALALPDLGPVDRVRLTVTRASIEHRVGDLAVSRAFAEEAVTLAEAVGDPGLMAQAWHRLGSVLGEVGGSEAGWDALERAVTLGEAAGQLDVVSHALERLGALALPMGRADQADALYQRSLRAARAGQFWRAESAALGSLANTQVRIGRVDEALPYYTTALDIHRRVGDRRYLPVVLGNIGLVHHARQRPDEALAHFEAAIEGARSVGDRRVEGVFLFNGGTLHHDQGRSDVARDWFERALAIFDQINYPRFTTLTLGNLGMLDLAAGRLEPARAHYGRARALSLEIGDPATAALWHVHEALVAARLGGGAAMSDGLDASLEVMRARGDLEWLASALGAVAECHFRAGDAARAEELASEMAAVVERLGGEPGSVAHKRWAELRAVLDGQEPG